MVNRADVLEQLSVTLADVEAFYADLDEAEMVRPITESAVHGEQDWSAKDHLAHLVDVEVTFRAVVERSLEGDPDPAGMATVTSVAEAISRQNQVNARTVVERRAATPTELMQSLRQARTLTLALVESTSDTQLASRVPGAPWGDGSVAGVLSTIAGHHGRHLVQLRTSLERRLDEG